MHLNMSSAMCFNLDQSTILSSGKGLRIVPTLDIRHLLRKMRSHMQVWNKIPTFIREAKTIHTFKKQFKNYLLDQQNK